MKMIPASGVRGRGLFVLVDDDVYEWAKDYKWHLSGKLQRLYPNNRWLGNLHRAIKGDKAGFVVDHKNRNTLDCRRDNLRWATTSQNNANSSTFRRCKGAYYQANGWYSRITVAGKDIYLGRFATMEEAARAYIAAAKKYFGEFYHP